MREDRQLEGVGTGGSGGYAWRARGGPSCRAPGVEGTALSLACPTSSCLAWSTCPRLCPLPPAPAMARPSHLSPDLARRLSPGSLCLQGCASGKHSQSTPGRGHSTSKGLESGRRGVCRAQAVTCGRWDDNLCLVHMGISFMQKPGSVHLLCAGPSGKHKRSFCPVGRKSAFSTRDQG